MSKRRGKDRARGKDKSYISGALEAPMGYGSQPHRSGAADSDSTRPANAAVIESLVAAIRTIIPLAEFAVSDEFSALERESLRERVGRNGVQRLSLLSTKLSSESARRVLPAYNEYE